MSEQYEFIQNTKVKKPGVQIEFTQEQVSEFIKCSRDPIYFINKYVKIIQVDEGLIPFNMWDFQEELVNVFHENRFAIAKLPRQVGKTQTVASYMLWAAMFNDKYTIAILANKFLVSREILARIKLSYEELPPWLQQGAMSWNKESIIFENGSRIFASSTSPDAIRGFAINILYLDEFAHVDKAKQDDFYTSVYPTITSGKTTKILITSTPNGLDLFYKIWHDSEENRNDFKRVECHWSDVPGRDENWRKQEIRNTSELQFEQEQECHFLGSSHTLISGPKLRTLTWKEPEFVRNNYKYFAPPKPDHQYIIVVDTGQGVGLDYSAFSVFDVTEMPYQVVCTYRDNYVHPITYPKFIFDTALRYNKAQVLIEMNDLGSQVADILHNEIEYENLIYTASKSKKIVATLGFGMKSTLGVKTSRSVKALGCSTLKGLVESDQLILNDYNIINELSHFALKNNSYEADQGNDDLVMSCVLFAWFTTQDFFKSLTDINTVRSMYDDSLVHIEEELTPFGVISTGQEPEYEVADGNLWRIG